MRKRLSELERFVMDYVWANPGCTAVECRDALAGSAHPMKESTVRTLFQRLETKGYVGHRVDGRTYRYQASEAKKSVAAEAVKQIVDRFCGGSVEELLVGMVDNDVVGGQELEQLARKIAAKKGERQ